MGSTEAALTTVNFTNHTPVIIHFPAWHLPRESTGAAAQQVPVPVHMKAVDASPSSPSKLAKLSQADRHLRTAQSPNGLGEY